MDNKASHIPFFVALIGLTTAYANYSKASALVIAAFLVLLVLLFVMYEQFNKKYEAQSGTTSFTFFFRLAALCVLLWLGYAMLSQEADCLTTKDLNDMKVKSLSIKQNLSTQIKEMDKKIKEKTKFNPNASTLELDLRRNLIEFKKNKLDSLSKIIDDSMKVNNCVSKSFINNINLEYEKIISN